MLKELISNIQVWRRRGVYFTIFCFLFVIYFQCHNISFADVQDSIPGIYEVASNDQINISITDVHCYEYSLDEWKLAMGLVVENRRGEKAIIDSNSFKILDSRGNLISPLKECSLKHSFGIQEVNPGELAVGGLAFKIKQGSRAMMLIAVDQKLKIRLDKEVRPPGIPNAVENPVRSGAGLVGIEGIFQHKNNRIFRVDYILKNIGPGVMLLEDRDYGRFGVLIDRNGWSYPVWDFKILGPAIPPGCYVDGYLTYLVPDGTHPRYLLFWPPDEDAVLFDLGTAHERPIGI